MAHVLIATDLSAHALNAARYAVQLFGADGNAFTLLHTFLTPPQDPALVPMVNDLTGRLAAEGVDNFARQLGGSLPDIGFDLATITAYGELDDVLRDMAGDDQRPDVVVMGARNTTQLERTLFGSNTSSVIRHAGLPVLTIPSEARYRNPSRIMLADDGGPVDRSAVKLLLDIARWSRSEVKIVHVVPEIGQDDAPAEPSGYDALLGAVPHSYHTVSGENVVVALNDLADQSDTDLVVVVHRQRGLLEQFFHHGTAANLALHTHIPMLVLQQPAA